MDNNDSRLSTAVARPSRRFIPEPPNAKPSDLFFTTSMTTAPTRAARFASKTSRPGHKYLIYISGRRSDPKARHRPYAVYAIVWGPDQWASPGSCHVDEELSKDEPQTAEWAQMRAVMTALDRLHTWYNAGPREVVFAFSGDWLLNHVARPCYQQEMVEMRAYGEF